MKITARYLNEVLEETVKDFNSKIYPLNKKVELEFIDKEKFMNDVKENPLIQQQIKMGLYKDIDREYPNFVVVYHKNNNPLLELFGLPFRISLCLEMAKDKLKPFSKNTVTAYLKHVFSHEIGHIVQDEVMKTNTDLWNKCLSETYNDESLAKELLVETMADMIGDKKEYEDVYNQLWGLIYNRTKKLSRGR